MVSGTRGSNNQPFSPSRTSSRMPRPRTLPSTGRPAASAMCAAWVAVSSNAGNTKRPLRAKMSTSSWTAGLPRKRCPMLGRQRLRAQKAAQIPFPYPPDLNPFVPMLLGPAGRTDQEVDRAALGRQLTNVDEPRRLPHRARQGANVKRLQIEALADRECPARIEAQPCGALGDRLVGGHECIHPL